MSRIVERTTRLDDLDGTDNAIPRFFEFDGVGYTVDLSANSFSAMTKVLRPFVDAATAVDGRPGWARPRRPGRPESTHGRSDAADVRAWAVEQGLDVAATGRIASSVLAAYDACDHPATAE